MRPPATSAGPDGPAERPRKTLGGFASLALDGGHRRDVSLSVPRRALARYDPTDGWAVDPGEYDVLVGRSSRDRRSQVAVAVE